MRRLVILAVALVAIMLPLSLSADYAQASPVSAVYRVNSVTDNCRVYYNGSTWVLSTTDISSVGYWTAAYSKIGSAFRFTNVSIPYGAPITRAYLIFNVYTQAEAPNTGVTVNSVIQGESTLAPAAFSTYADFAARPKMTPVVYWQNIPAWPAGATVQSPDITQMVQAMVNRSGWQPGGSMVLFWGDTAGQSTAANNVIRLAYSYSFNSALAVSLYVTYDYSGGPTIPSYPSSPSYSDPSADLAALRATTKATSDSVDNLVRQFSSLGIQVDRATVAATGTQTALQGMQSVVNDTKASTAAASTSIASLSTQTKSIVDTQVTMASNLSSIKSDVAALGKLVDANTAAVVKATDASAKLADKVGIAQTCVIIVMVVQFLILVLLFALVGRKPPVAAPVTNTLIVPADSVVPGTEAAAGMLKKRAGKSSDGGK